MDWSYCLSQWRQVEKVWSERREVTFRHAEYQSCSLGILVDISTGLWVCSLWGEGWAGGIHLVVMIYRQGCQATALNEPKKSRAWVLACVHQGKGHPGIRSALWPGPYLDSQPFLSLSLSQYPMLQPYWTVLIPGSTCLPLDLHICGTLCLSCPFRTFLTFDLIDWRLGLENIFSIGPSLIPSKSRLFTRDSP